MRICDLSEGEARGYELSGVLPKCNHHRHLAFTAANELCESDAARWVGDGQRRITRTPQRVWAVRNGWSLPSVQMVDLRKL